VSIRIRLRRGTAAEWTSANPVLAAGEAGVETDTGKMKVGDGSTAWNALGYSTATARGGDLAVADGGTGASTATAARTSLSFDPLLTAELVDVFSLRPNGAIAGSSSATGQVWTQYNNATDAGAALVVSGGVMTNNPSLAGNSGGYAERQLAGNVRRIGGRFSFGSGSTDQAVVLAVWKTSWAINTPPVPDSPLHFVVTPTAWNVDTIAGGSFTSRASGTFSAPLAQDGTVYTMTAEIVGTTVTVALPDGTVQSFTNAAVAANAGAFAVFECYKNDGSTTGRAAFHEVWADSQTYRPGILTPTDVQRRVAASELSAAVWRPTVVTYTPGTDVGVAIPTSDAEIDATNLSISVVVPPSGRLLMRLHGNISMTAADRVFWSLRQGATSYAMKEMVNQQYTGALTWEAVITGLTPGATQTFAWRHWRLSGTGTATFLLDTPNGRQAIMTATPY